MKRLKLSALIFGALVFVGVGATALNAKCGDAGVKKEAPKTMKCGAGKCGGDKNITKKMKCGTGKCGDAKKEAPKTVKCGAGKCGAN